MRMRWGVQTNSIFRLLRLSRNSKHRPGAALYEAPGGNNYKLDSVHLYGPDRRLINRFLACARLRPAHEANGPLLSEAGASHRRRPHNPTDERQAATTRRG
mgnify:CR=1 FL=1